MAGVSEKERELIRNAVRGDEASFEALILSCKGRAYNIAFRYMGNEEDAMDAMQEAYIKIYRGLASFNMESSFDTWVYRIVVNTCNDALRRRKKISMLQIVYSEDENRDTIAEIPDNSPLPDEIFENKEEGKYILKCLERIEEDHREILILRDIQGFSYVEIARMLNCSMGTVKSRISRARKKLKEIYLEQMQKNCV